MNQFGEKHLIQIAINAKKTCKILFSLLFLLSILLFFIEVCYSNEDLLLTIKANKSNYKVGDEVIINFIITNQSKEDVQIYFINIYEAQRYLSIETLDGNKLTPQITSLYSWENPTFHLVRAKSYLKKEMRATITKNNRTYNAQGLEFKDLFYELKKFSKIKITGFFNCSNELAKGYQKKYPKDIKKDFWTGEIKSSPIIIKIE